jgi:cysteinyl-tRNA synthetase
MSNASKAFAAVREAQSQVDSKSLKLSQLQALKREILGWNSPVAQFRTFADEQIKTLPRGDKEKKTLRRQKNDLSKAVNTLRDSIRVSEDINRMARASKADNKVQVRMSKAVVQASEAFDRIIGCNRDEAIKFAKELLARAENPETTVDVVSETTVEITD